MNLSEKIYSAVRLIPRGRVATYADIARAVGRPRAWRHVGNILNKNRDRRIPCHRVVRSDGLVGGFGFPSGSQGKIRRLAEEGVRVKNGMLDLACCRAAPPLISY